MSGSMHFIRAGAGAPPLVFVHGFACAHDDWGAQLAHFRDRHEVLACDLRGHGATPGTPGQCTIVRQGADVAGWLRDLGLREVVLIGHSMGCRVVLEAARLEPARFAALVLLDGSMVGMGDPAQAEAVVRSIGGAAGFPAFADAQFQGMFLGESALSRRIVARARALPGPIGAGLYASLANWDVEHMRAALGEVRVPLLAIQSTWMDASRRRLPLAEGQSSPWLDLVRETVASARVEVIAGAGHFPQIERATEVNALIDTFIAPLAASAPQPAR